MNSSGAFSDHSSCSMCKSTVILLDLINMCSPGPWEALEHPSWQPCDACCRRKINPHPSHVELGMALCTPALARVLPGTMPDASSRMKIDSSEHTSWAENKWDSRSYFSAKLTDTFTFSSEFFQASGGGNRTGPLIPPITCCGFVCHSTGLFRHHRFGSDFSKLSAPWE